MTALMFKEFKEFAIKGNVLDLAVGIIIGGAFGKIVSSLVNDVVMPPFALILGRINFNDRYFILSGKSYRGLADAKAAGAVTINYGQFLNNLIEFLVISFVLFLIIKQINRFRRQPLSKETDEKICQFCATKIPLKAIRCPNCTSNIK